MSFILLGILNSQVEATAAGAFDLLETTVLGSTTTTVTFSNLNNYSDYKHLQIRMSVRDATSGTGQDSLRIRLNSDTASNYTHAYFRGTGSAGQSNYSTSQTSITIALSFIPRSGETSQAFGSGILDILNFGSSTNKTTVRLFAGSYPGQVGSGWGHWNTTDAVTSITLSEGSTNGFISGSRFSLYGWK